MKVVILAGGYGTRLSEETDVRPKPMVEIGGKPILWHLMHIYSRVGFSEFVICAGYKASFIKKYFVDYFLQNSDIEVDTATGDVKYLSGLSEAWKVKVIDTGLDTMTGGRLKRVAEHLGNGPFCMTYGDGLADLDPRKTVKFHQDNKKLATVTAVRSPGRFGIINMDDEGGVTRFHEKPDNESGWINGGFFVLDPAVVNYIGGDETIWEKGPLVQLATEGQLAACKHDGFWKPMDTLRDKMELEAMWAKGDAPWTKEHAL